jgi:hypothetical protein
MITEESPLSVTIKGAISGPVGTMVGTLAMTYTPQIMQQLGLAEQQGRGIISEAMETPA